jgi:hypothetical protein
LVRRASNREDSGADAMAEHLIGVGYPDKVIGPIGGKQPAYLFGSLGRCS